MKKRYGLLLFMFAMALVLLGCVLLVTNRQQAATQAKQIVLRDQAGESVETDLIKLKVFAASHMKVNVELVLSGSYDRAVIAAKAKSDTSSATYAAAQKSCDQKGVDSIRQSQCVAAYIAARGASAPKVVMPKLATYKYAYVGPGWSFDAAGILLTVGLLLAIVGIGSVLHRTVTN